MRNVVGLLALVLSSSACSGTSTPPASSPAGTSASTIAPGASGTAASSDASPAAGAPSAGAAPSGHASSPIADTGSTLGAVDTREDAHWIQADDYFVASHAFGKGWDYVWVAKMKEPPSEATKGEALFFVIKDGGEKRSAHFYRTRPAVKADLVLGNLLICFDHNKKGKVYGAPRDKDNARPGVWWIARITDLSDLDKGYATLSGSYHCAPDALRAIVK